MLTDGNRLLKLLGLRPTGDIGPYTIYTTRRHATVIYPRSPPLKPPSTAQLRQRQAWTAAAKAWTDLSDAHKSQWTTAAKLARLNITGYNLWIWYNLSPHRPTLATIERHSQTSLLST